MELSAIEVNGETEYFCSKKQRQCVIQATFFSDGAALIACDMSDDNFLDLWLTEACFLSLIPKSDKEK